MSKKDISHEYINKYKSIFNIITKKITKRR